MGRYACRWFWRGCSTDRFALEAQSFLKATRTEILTDLAKAAGVAICYLVTAQVGLAFAIPPGTATVVWPASGIALAALLLFGYRMWPAIWIASILVNLTTGVSPAMAVAFATGNVLEGLLGAWLLKRFLPVLPFQRAVDVLIFASVASTSCVPAATVGAGAMLLTGRIGVAEFRANWSTWWLGDLAGQYILVPLLLALAHKTLDTRQRFPVDRAACLVRVADDTELVHLWEYSLGTARGTSALLADGLVDLGQPPLPFGGDHVEYSPLCGGGDLGDLRGRGCLQDGGQPTVAIRSAMVAAHLCGNGVGRRQHRGGTPGSAGFLGAITTRAAARDGRARAGGEVVSSTADGVSGRPDCFQRGGRNPLGK